MSVLETKPITVTFTPKRLISIWSGMIDRCHNKTSKHYKNYGGRRTTIFVCRKWRESFAEFAWWALHNGYTDSLTIERKNNNLGYGPRNCVFITLQQQQQNKTTSSHHTFFGKRKILSEWSRHFGIPVETLRRRIRRGWKNEKLFTKASAKSGHRHIFAIGKDCFRVRVQHNNEMREVGRFRDLNEAIEARDNFLIKTKGEKYVCK